MSSHDSAWSTGSLASYLEDAPTASAPLQPSPRRAPPRQLSLTSQSQLPVNLTPFPPPTPSGSIFDTTGSASDVAEMLQQTAALLTPAPSPGQSSARRLWEEPNEGGGPSSGFTPEVSGLEAGLRSLWNTIVMPSQSSQAHAETRALIDPQALIQHFHSFTSAQRFAFLALLVPSLRLNEALVVSRKIEPRLKRDFLRDLPGELALHCLSFITEARTLTQAAQVSRHWYRLLQDEQTWKDMCLWHRFTPIITPLAQRHSTGNRTPDMAVNARPMWDIGQSIWGGHTGLGLGVRNVMSESGQGSAGIATNAQVDLGAVVGPLPSLAQGPEYYVPHSIPLGPHPSLRDYGRQNPGFKAQFKDAYQTQRNWLHGGRVLKQFIAISEDDGVVTSLAINDHYMIVGMANSRIHVFDAHTARFRCSLVGHERGVWTLILVSPAVPEPGDDDYITDRDASPSGYSSNHDIPRPSGSHPGHRADSTSASRNNSPYRNSSNNSNSQGPSTEAAYTYVPPVVGFDPSNMPASYPYPSNPSSSGSRYAFGPTQFGSSCTSSQPSNSTSAPYSSSQPRSASASGGSHHTRSGRRAASSHNAKRMRSSDICGSARGWAPSGLGARHLVVSGGCDRRVKVWDVSTGACIHSLAGHNSTIRCLKVLDRRPIAISGSRDNSLRVWDIHKGVLLRQLVGHTGSVRCVEIAGNMAVSGSYDNTARVWNVDTGDCVHVLHGHYHQIYSCAFDGERIITGSLDSTVRVWNAETGDCLALLQGHTSLVGQLQLIGDRLLTGGSDGRVIVFDLSTYECLHRLCAHDNSVTCLQFDDRFIISGGMDGRVKLWDIRTGAFIRELTKPCTSIWRIGCRDDRVVILAQRETRTVLESLTFRPGEVVGKSLVV